MGRMIRQAAFPRRERAQEWIGSGVREWLSSPPLACACGERKKGERRLYICVCMREECKSALGDAVCDGPT